MTNTEPASHGEDREEDPAFKARIRDYWGTARRGILEAIALGARSVPGIDSATALEVITPDAYPGRVVQLFVADSTGNTSRALTQTVIDALLDYRAAGIAVIVSGSIPQMVDVVLNLVFQAGVSSDLLTERIRAVLVGTINSLPVNSTLTRGVLQTQLTRFAAEGLIATESTLVAPTGDLVPTPGSTIRTTLDRVTVL